MAKEIVISTSALDVLGRSGIEGNILKLPQGQLDRPLYLEVDSVLKALGGKWDRKAGGHVFDDDPSLNVEIVLATGRATKIRQELQSFFSPPEIVRLLLNVAELPLNSVVLEPSAGKGHIAKALVEAGHRVVACEIHPPFRKVLEEMEGVSLMGEDFLKYVGGNWRRIVANPPFTRQQDLAHVTHMIKCLGKDGIVVSVMSNGVMFRTDRRTRAFQELIAPHQFTFTPLPDDAFKESGTMVRTVVLKLRKTG